MSKSAAQKRAERSDLKPLLAEENRERTAKGWKTINMMAFKAKLKRERAKATRTPGYNPNDWKIREIDPRYGRLTLIANNGK
jgi:hypothetical protein